MNRDTEETVSELVDDALPIACGDLTEPELIEMISAMETLVGVTMITALDSVARLAGESLDGRQSAARAMLLTLRLFQTALAHFKSYIDDEIDSGILH